MSDLRPEAMTWTALLGRWIDFARASLSLPADAEGERWRASVAPIINLQACTFALADLDELAPADRFPAVDRASYLIDEQTERLREIWSDASDMPPMIAEIMRDARVALQSLSKVTQLIWPGLEIELDSPAEGRVMDMPPVEVEHYEGTIAVMQPGTMVMPREPVAWWMGGSGIEIDGCVAAPARRPAQVYRILERGVPVRDVIATIDDDPPAGDALPLLVPLFANGERIGDFTLDAKQWHDQQRAAIGQNLIPVEHV